MSATVQLDRPIVLVIHDDGGALDLMTRLFEQSGFEVVTAVSGFRAQAHLEGERPIDVVVAPWDQTASVGGEVYRWSLQNRYDLRDRFIFIASEVPSDFDRIVAGRCLAVAMSLPSEIVRVALAALQRRARLEESIEPLMAEDATVLELDLDRPTLLLADDDPVLLMVMADLLGEAGYSVSRVESGHAAIAQLEHDDFDVIVADWQMDAGIGAELYRWVCDYRPWLAERVVFLSGEGGDDAAVVALGRPMFRKGQDSQGLSDMLHEIVRQVRQVRTQG